MNMIATDYEAVLKARYVDAMMYFREQVSPADHNDFLAYSQATFNALLRLYSEKQRSHYHGPLHLVTMLNVFDQIVKEAGNRLTKLDIHTVELAIFFHDVIYVPGNSDNEEQSVVWMENTLSADTPIGDKLKHMILATKHVVNSETDFLTQIFLDIDLWGMGTSAFEEFYDTTARIRAEFSHVSDMDFLRSRVRFVDMMNARLPIFYNPLGLNSLIGREPAAVTNLTSERSQFTYMLDSINHLNRYTEK